MNTKTIRNTLLMLLAVLGTGAILGGGVLIISPTGKLFGMPLSMLEHSPFNSFLIPGIILFCVLGLIPVSLTYALLKKPEIKWAERLNFYPDMYWAWTYTIYVSFALIIWIQLEMSFIRAVHWSHTLYVFFAIAILYVALLPKIRQLYATK